MVQRLKSYCSHISSRTDSRTSSWHSENGNAENAEGSRRTSQDHDRDGQAQKEPDLQETQRTEEVEAAPSATFTSLTEFSVLTMLTRSLHHRSDTIEKLVLPSRKSRLICVRAGNATGPMQSQWSFVDSPHCG